MVKVVVVASSDGSVVNIIQKPNVVLFHLEQTIHVKSIIYDGQLAACMVCHLIEMIRKPKILEGKPKDNQYLFVNYQQNVKQWIDFNKITIKYSIENPTPYEENISHLFESAIYEASNNNIEGMEFKSIKSEMAVNKTVVHTIDWAKVDYDYNVVKKNGREETCDALNKSTTILFTSLVSTLDELIILSPVLCVLLNLFLLKQDYDFHIHTREKFVIIFIFIYFYCISIFIRFFYFFIILLLFFTLILSFISSSFVKFINMFWISCLFLIFNLYVNKIVIIFVVL